MSTYENLTGTEAAALGDTLFTVWMQARKNHEQYSATGTLEDDIRFLALGLTGEAGELANFIKKRWRDGDDHEDDICREIADLLAYAFMLADRFGLTPLQLLEIMEEKQKVFIAKMQAKDTPND